ncbi:ATPase, T2SS/T4P/T4SS family [Sporosalibacterium faouarense]|uniref:ATPase, T2SS/T4P/T4SS family n=1 Tax=Sporosalibacterium faouarense TaxID=516123 RepID=UPI00141CC52A|nr:ATPase, T2SS/T4P/T4SS family [Sporosalibacterium faouarense]MTI48732.1 hypothetical protein [Bacillota bacterium]
MNNLSNLLHEDLYDFLEHTYKEKIDDLFKDIDTYQSLFGIKERELAKKDVKMLQDLKKLAIGNNMARKYVINQYLNAMLKVLKVEEEELDTIINFKEISNNDSRILLEILLDMYDMSEIINKYNIKTRFTEEELREIILCEENKIKESYADFKDRLKILAIILYTINDGKNLIDTLTYHSINEVGIRDKDYIYIIYKGEKIYIDFLKFNKTSILRNIQYKTTRNASSKYDESNPTVTTTLQNSNRITVAGYSAVPSSKYWYYNERIFNLGAITLEELRDEYKTIDQKIYDLLLIHTRGRGSHLVSGSDMGVGKTTFLTAMIEKIPNEWGIGILDAQDEIQAQEKFSHKNIKPLIENPYRTVDQLFQQMLKMSRDIAIVGEIVKSEHMAEMMNAALRLNAGVGGTMHLYSPFEAVANCVNLLMRTKMYDESKTAESDVSRALDLIIHLSKLKNGRIVVESIIEIEHIEDSYYLEPVLKGKRSTRIGNLINMAQLSLKKYLYPHSFKYKEIIRYNMEKDIWEIRELPSEKYFNKLIRHQHITLEEIDDFRESFMRVKD